jgi:tetratricopeptide (TPR) repeat protein
MARLNEAVDLFPTYYMALERLGVEFVKQGRHEPALIVLSKAVEVNPSGPDSLYALGVAQYRLKKYSQSEDALRKMITLAPGSSNAPFGYYFLGLALIRGGKPGEAEPYLKRAHELGGKNIPSDIHMALAQIYSNTKRYKEAISELELFLKKAPDAQDADKVRAIIQQLRSKQ